MAIVSAKLKAIAFLNIFFQWNYYAQRSATPTTQHNTHGVAALTRPNLIFWNKAWHAYLALICVKSTQLAVSRTISTRPLTTFFFIIGLWSSAYSRHPKNPMQNNMSKSKSYKVTPNTNEKYTIKKQTVKRSAITSWTTNNWRETRVTWTRF